MRSVTIRPAPEWVAPGRLAAEPVSRKRPGVRSASTARRTRSHDSGSRCHSSMRVGGSPVTRRTGSPRAISRASGSSSRKVVRARRRAVAVLPTPLGPSSEMAGRPASSSSSSRSTTRYGWRVTRPPRGQAASGSSLLYIWSVPEHPVRCAVAGRPAPPETRPRVDPLHEIVAHDGAVVGPSEPPSGAPHRRCAPPRLSHEPCRSRRSVRRSVSRGTPPTRTRPAREPGRSPSGRRASVAV